MPPLDQHDPACPIEAGCTVCTPATVAADEAAAFAPRKPYLSWTQISMLAKCGTQYEFRYIRGIKSPPGVALALGKGVHGAVEHDLRNKMEWGELLPDEAVGDHARDATGRAWDEQPPVLHDGDPDRGGAIDTAVSLAHLHHKAVAPKLEPIAIERGFVLDLGPSFKFDLLGYVDVEEQNTIRDTKTSSKAPNKDAADVSDQLTLYHLDATVRGHKSKAVALDYLVKKGRPEAITLTSARGPLDHMRLLRRVEQAARVIQAGAFAPTARDSWACSEKWCGYWHMCDFGAKQKVSVALIDPKRLTSRRAERRP